MRYEDEHYVKLYTRDTPTWRAMRWESRALLPMLMRVVDKAGLLECGELGRGAVALMVAMPDEVVGAGLKDLERFGVVAWHGAVLLLPKFEDAQEARKSDAQSKRDQRARARDKAKAEALGIPKELSDGVRASPEVSEPVRLQPDPVLVPDPVPISSTTAPEEKFFPMGRAVEAPTTPVATWTGDDFWRWAQRLRVKGKLIPEKRPKRNLSFWWSSCLMTSGVTPKAMQDGFYRFGQSKHWEKSDPPHPFEAFMSDWEKYVRPEEKHGPAATG